MDISYNDHKDEEIIRIFYQIELQEQIKKCLELKK